MDSNGHSIAKNASVLMGAQLITWTFGILLTIFLPRYLGAEGIGQYYIAIALWAIIDVIADFGTETLVVKEVARDKEKAANFFGTVITLRLMLFLISSVGLLLYVYFVEYSETMIYVILVIGISMLIQQVATVCRVWLQGLERMEYISLSEIFAKVFTTVTVIPLLLLGFNVVHVALVSIGTSLVSLSAQLIPLRRMEPLRIRPNVEQMRWVFKESLPYLLVSVLLVAYTQIDVIIISLIIDEETVGWYAAARNLFGNFLFVPTVFLTAVFPVLSRAYKNDPNMSSKVFRKSFNLLLLLGVPIGFGIVVVSEQIVLLLFGSEFAPSGQVLAILGFVLVLTYLNVLFGYTMLSTDRQSTWTIVMAIATIATIFLDILLIPWAYRVFGNGAIGGGLAYVVTELFMVLAGLYLVPKKFWTRSDAYRNLRVIAAGLIMLVVTWPVRQQFIIIPVAVGMLSYTAMILLIKGIAKEDWQLVQNMLQRIGKRLGIMQSKPA